MKQVPAPQRLKLKQYHLAQFQLFEKCLSGEWQLECWNSYFC